jgi:hypothetical protein
MEVAGDDMLEFVGDGRDRNWAMATLILLPKAQEKAR